jgi:formamidopyrimidine-DNA glycosylase
MPELPEVEVVRSGLAPVLTGAGIARVHVRDPRSLKRHLGPLESFIDELEGTRLDTPLRRGKFMWVPLAGQKPCPGVPLGDEWSSPVGG